MEPIRIFFCCTNTPQDQALRDQLETHIMVLKRLNEITLRLTLKLEIEKNWKYEQDPRFQTADLILLLVSPDFIKSDYHYGIEMRHALEKHEAGNVWVIPIILRPTALWEKTPFGKLQALPKDGKAITTQRNRDATFADIVEEISKIVAELLSRKQTKKAIEGIFPKFTQVIGTSLCITCGARNSLGVDNCENCRDILLQNMVDTSLSIESTSNSNIQVIPTQSEEIHSATQSSRLPKGTILDEKFKIIDILAYGRNNQKFDFGTSSSGTKTVYKVEEIGASSSSSSYYAVKELFINPHTNKKEHEVALERFNKEIALLRDLKHPHIAAFWLSFQEKGRYYFVMEFVPGRTLEKVLEDTKVLYLSEDQVILWMMGVCQALTYIHTCAPSIIHCDLKPKNIMVSDKNGIQLIDFAIAFRVDPKQHPNIANLETISYASPEVLGAITAPNEYRSTQNPSKFARIPRVDARSDIYSLGATMYHLLTKQEPELIQAPALGSILGKNPILRTVLVGQQLTVCPVEQVVIKAMQPDPKNRFQSAEAMRVALSQCLPVICQTCGFANLPGAIVCRRGHHIYYSGRNIR
jgi:ribosomal protein L40E